MTMETNLTSISPNSHGDDILVVDDEAPLLAVAQAILQTVGLTPATASEGGDAVKWVQERIDAKLPVSLVILDLTMPGGLSGFETLEAMREICPNLPVIACSGFFAEGARDLCQAIGFTDILAKPYSPDALLRFARGEMTESIQRSDSPLADAPTADPPQGDSPSDWTKISNALDRRSSAVEMSPDSRLVTPWR